MAFDIFLLLDTIKGESTDDNHRDWIKLSSFSFGASNPASVGSGDSPISGQPTLSNFMVTKETDVASVNLFGACTQGKELKSMKVEVCTQSGNKIPIVVYEFKQVIVAGIQWSGAGGTSDRPGESVSFAFGSVQVSYTPINPNETAGTKIGPIAWNVLKNKPVMTSKL
ncbi:unnamed protein product [Blepharisma stoltei]|uniref:Type VI secretion system tube protein Hcp n=1 Tax=Blepharisma stoltei TaxID=1481888 RepID=A0AAU9JAX9_9CILI|nr:unnamed protein product [Blepharisma stoltei]